KFPISSERPIQIMRVFLSYADSDMELAKGLASQLSKQGYEVWHPYQNLFPGDNWSLKIGEALKESKAMVVLLSPDSVRSQWVRREIAYALGDPNYSGDRKSTRLNSS